MSPSFLQELAQPRPDPGGGAAAAHSGALAVALLLKVVQLEGNRPGQDEAQKPAWDDFLQRVHQVAGAFWELQSQDVQAYDNLARARADGSPGELAAALDEAVACPWRIMGEARKALAMIAAGGARCRPHLVSDLLVACELLGAAFRGAHHIARANLPLMPGHSERAAWAEELSRTLQAAEAALQEVKAGLLNRAHTLDHRRG